MGLFSSECSNCGSKEHSTSDCPHGLFSSECGNCGSKEHATSDCPHGFFSSECGNCGSKDHATSDCPHGLLSSECGNCGSKEHATSDCPHGFFSSECGNCGSKDHATSDCPHGLFGGRSEPDLPPDEQDSSDDQSSGDSGSSSGSGGYSYTPTSNSTKNSGCGTVVSILLLGGMALWIWSNFADKINAPGNRSAGNTSKFNSGQVNEPIRPIIPDSAPPSPPRFSVPTYRPFVGSGTIYKIPQLKNLVGLQLVDAWLYGAFVYREHSGNTVKAVTGAKLILVGEGFTDVYIECVGGFTLRPSTVRYFRTQLRQPPAPVFEIRKGNPLRLLRVEKSRSGRISVFARYEGALTL